MSTIYKDKEIWVDVEGYEGIYQVSNHGGVKTLDRMSSSGTRRLIKGKILKPVNDGGYHKRLLADNGNGRKNLNIHREVAKHFVHNPNPEVFEIINHKDGNGMNNHHSNLEWCTHLHNVTHAIENGLRMRSPHQTLSVDEVKEIRELFDQTNMSYSAIARMYNMGASTITSLIQYKSFPNVEPEKQYEYKINKLKGKELKKWLKTKFKKKSLLELINKDDLNSLIYEYTNSTIRLNILCQKYGAPTMRIKKHINSLEKVPFKKLNGEKFKKLNDEVAVSNMGRIFNLKTKRLGTQSGHVNGKSLKTVVAKLFLPNPNNFKIVKCKDGTKNFHVDNLQWCKSVLQTIDEKYANIKNKVINDYVNSELSKEQITKKYGVSHNAIKKLCRGLIRKKEPQILIGKETAINIRNDYPNNDVKELANKYNLTMGYVYRVLNNEIWPNKIYKNLNSIKKENEIKRLQLEGFSIEKLCPTCKTKKHRVHDFYKDKTQEDGRHRQCIPCLKEYLIKRS